MNEINELLRTLYPKGIEFKELGEICVFRKGNSLSKADKGQGDIPIILYGELYTTYNNYITNIISSTSEDRAQTATTASKGNLLLPISSTTKEAKIGKASVICVDSPVYIGGDTLILEHQQCAGYLVHLINSNWFEKQKMMCVHGTTIMHLHPKELAKIRIPIPPLPVQEEIVRILDKFTELEAELEKELEARKKQYEWYRDRLLSFDESVPMVKLEDIATDIYRGAGIRRDEVTSDGIPCIRYGEIYTSYDISFTECISHTQENIVSALKYFEHGDILFAITGESIEEIGKSIAYLGREKCMAGGDIVVMKHNQEPRYISYALSTTAAQMQKSKGKVKSKVVHSSVPALKEIEIPLPDIATQKRIADLLDSFHALCNDITTGLPAEIAARRKQYEYYRDKLLSFEEVA